MITARRLAIVLSAGVLSVSVLAARPAAQGQVLFSDDFELGLGPWQIVQAGNPLPPQPLWHLADIGECGAVGKMAAYNLGPSQCNYATPGTNQGSILSPAIKLEGQHPFRVSMHYMLHSDVPADSATISLLDVNSGVEQQIFNGLQQTETPVFLLFSVPGITWAGKTVRVRLSFSADNLGNGGFGWLVDDVSVLNKAPTWTDLGNAKPGVAGAPQLTGDGSLVPGSLANLNTLALEDAAPHAPAMLVFGLSQANAPFKGGVVVPAPLLIQPMTTDPAGASALDFLLPGGVPLDANLYFQFWIKDAAATNGWSASNGLLGEPQ